MFCHYQLYQKIMAQAYDKKFRPRVLQKEDLVLILHLPREDRSKWAPNYRDLYMVKKAFSRRALMLDRMDGKDLARPVNSDSITIYYVSYI